MTEEKINEERENNYRQPLQQRNMDMKNTPYLSGAKGVDTLTQTQKEITEVMNELKVLLIKKKLQLK